MKVLIASCIRQEPHILNEFLIGLDDLEKPKNTDYYFILHNLPRESKQMIYRWRTEKRLHLKIMSDDLEYTRDDGTTHIWKPEVVDKVIEMKEDIISYAKNHGYDYLFFTDSDQVYHPKTLNHLIKQEVDIIGCISWAKWQPGTADMPNAWFKHPYGFDGRLNELRETGIIKVEGFGGCYLLSKKALESGVSFNRVEGEDHWGEDRHFHIRARRLGFDSYVSTVSPYFHIYRDNDIFRLNIWKQNGYTDKAVTVREGSILIAVPIGEKWIHPDLNTWLIKTLRENPNWGYHIHRMHPIDSNRNAIVNKFLHHPDAQKYEYILMVDSDVVPPPLGAERLISHDKKIVGGVCFIMGNDGMPVPNISKELEGGRYKAELIEVKGMGTGCMLIHREVLEKIGSNWFRFRYDETGMATVAGEDYDFCEKAVNQGYKIYTDLRVQCEHYKEVGLLTLNRKLASLVTGNNGEQRSKS